MKSASVIAVAIGALSSALILSRPTEARAELVTGNMLYGWCSIQETDPERWQKESICTGYIMGVHDGIENAAIVMSGAAELEKSLRFACVPDNVTAGQINDIAVDYLRDHPATRHEGAGALVMLSIMEAFPCNRD